jgi:S1 RNA binding domain
VQKSIWLLVWRGPSRKKTGRNELPPTCLVLLTLFDLCLTLFRDDGYGHGEYVECRILNFDFVRNQIDISLRPSRIQGDLDDDPEPQIGDVVQGFVVVTNKKGCFVRISRRVEGRSTIKEIATDSYRIRRLLSPPAV